MNDVTSLVSRLKEYQLCLSNNPADLTDKQAIDMRSIVSRVKDHCRLFLDKTEKKDIPFKTLLKTLAGLEKYGDAFVGLIKLANHLFEMREIKPINKKRETKKDGENELENDDTPSMIETVTTCAVVSTAVLASVHFVKRSRDSLVHADSTAVVRDGSCDIAINGDFTNVSAMNTGSLMIEDSVNVIECLEDQGVILGSFFKETPELLGSLTRQIHEVLSQIEVAYDTLGLQHQYKANIGLSSAMCLVGLLLYRRKLLSFKKLAPPSVALVLYASQQVYRVLHFELLDVYKARSGSILLLERLERINSEQFINSHQCKMEEKEKSLVAPLVGSRRNPGIEIAPMSKKSASSLALLG